MFDFVLSTRFHFTSLQIDPFCLKRYSVLASFSSMPREIALRILHQFVFQHGSPKVDVIVIVPQPIAGKPRDWFRLLHHVATKQFAVQFGLALVLVRAKENHAPLAAVQFPRVDHCLQFRFRFGFKVLLHDRVQRGVFETVQFNRGNGCVLVWLLGIVEHVQGDNGVMDRFNAHVSVLFGF